MSVTVEELQSALPAKLKVKVDQNLVAEVNQLCADPEMGELFRENVIGYGSVLQDGKYKMTDYLTAVKFCSYKFGNLVDREAYFMTFPHKEALWKQQGLTNKVMSTYISAYRHTKLVTKIMQQAMIPVYLANQDLFNKALKTQCAIMIDEGVSPKVRSDAADSVMKHLKQPETATVELNVNNKANEDSIGHLSRAVEALVEQQNKALASGKSITDITEQGLVIENEADND